MPNDAVDGEDGDNRMPTGRLLQAVWWFAGLAVLVSVARHGLDALPAEAWSGLHSAWLPVGIHLVCGLVALGLGYLVLSWTYPLRGLARCADVNPAAALQAGAHLLGSAVIAAAAWGGADIGSLLVSAAFCALGWASLAGVLALHRLITRYRDHEEVADGNLASALASAGLHLAVALVVGHAIEGQFEGWRTSLTAFAAALAWVLLLYPLRQVVLARIILGLTPRRLDEAVARRHDLGLGAAEALCYVIAAFCLSAGW